jgi:hypothetical protein
MNAHRHHEMDIDRLVDGELPSENRRSLLLQLDSVPNGWKQCALAFLEAQAWRTGFGESTQAASSPLAIEHRPKLRRMSPWLAWAAMIVIAFVSGRALRPAKVAAVPQGVANQSSPSPAAQPGPLVPRPMPLLTGETKSNTAPAPYDYLQGRLEREGFRVERDQVLVPATTKAGRTVAVPVQRIRVRYVGNRAV